MEYHGEGSPIRYAGHAVRGFALGEDTVARFRALLDEMIATVRRFTKKMTPREVLILRIGLEASHLEESVAQGDWTRAEAHIEKLTDLLSQLGAMERSAMER